MLEWEVFFFIFFVLVPANMDAGVPADEFAEFAKYAEDNSWDVCDLRPRGA